MPPEIRQVVNGEAQANDAATYRYRLPNAGALHSLLLRVSCTNGATSGRNVSIFDVVDDIRIVADGSNVIFQQRPKEIEKYHESVLQHTLEINQVEAAAGVQQGVFPILFGREVYDPEIWLPLQSFGAVFLEVDYSPTISATVGFATGTTTIDLVQVMTPADQALTYRGTLVTVRRKEITTAASGQDITEIIRRFPIRLIGLYCWESATEDGVDVTRVELLANSGVKTLYAADWPEALSGNRELFGMGFVRHQMRLLSKDAEVIDTRIGRISEQSALISETAEIGADTNLIFTTTTIAGDRLTITQSVVTETTTTTPEAADTVLRDVFLAVGTFGPSFYVVLPFHMPDVPESYLPATAYNKLEVYATQGGAGGTYGVTVQELATF